MAQLRHDYHRFAERKAIIIVVGPERAEVFRSYWEKESLPFVGLPDPTHSVLRLFGQEVNLFKLGRMPAQVIIDRQGIARYAHYGHSMSDIPANEELLNLLDQIEVSRSDQP
jgi:peroxiredoxin Q/BCP